MRRCLRLLAVFLAAALAGSPARATSVYEYAKGEYVLIDSGMAPNGHLSLAAHGEGEFGSENFYVYLMAEPAHRRIAALGGITDNLDSGPTAFRAAWAPDSRHVAVAYRIERHVTVTLLYRIERGRAVEIDGPSLFKEVTSRDVDDGTDHENNSFTSLSWLTSRRVVIPAAMGIALAAGGALESDRAPSMGGRPPASLCARPIPKNRNGVSRSGALWRIRIHRGLGVRHAVGSPVLKSSVGKAKRAHHYSRLTLNSRFGGHGASAPLPNFA